MISPDLTRISGSADGQSPATLQVDVIADFACPWSYLGKRRLDDALSAVRGPSRVTWYPFQVNPKMPASGMPLDEYLRANFGDPESLRPGMNSLTEAGVAEGIHFQFDRIRRVPNTLNAHRLMQLAESRGRDTSLLAEVIFHAFFEYGRDIGDQDELVRLGETVGLDARSIRETLDSDTSRRMVLAQESQVRQNGVTGVPDFLINKRLFVIGAQATESLVRIFDSAMFGEDSDLTMSSTVH